MTRFETLAASLNLDAWYRLGEASGDFMDSTGKHDDAVVVGAGPTRSAASLIASDAVDKAVDFQEVDDDGIQLPASIGKLIGGTSPFGIAMVLDPDAHSHDFISILSSHATNDDAGVEIVWRSNDDGSLEFSRKDSNGNKDNATAEGAFRNSGKHSLVCNYDGSTLQLYIDAVPGDAVASTRTVNTEAPQLGRRKVIVGSGTDRRPFNGRLDEVMFRATPFTRREVDLLHLAAYHDYATGDLREIQDAIDSAVSGNTVTVSADKSVTISEVISNRSTGAVPYATSIIPKPGVTLATASGVAITGTLGSEAKSFPLVYADGVDGFTVDAALKWDSTFADATVNENDSTKFGWGRKWDYFNTLMAFRDCSGITVGPNCATTRTNSGKVSNHAVFMDSCDAHFTNGCQFDYASTMVMLIGESSGDYTGTIRTDHFSQKSLKVYGNGHSLYTFADRVKLAVFAGTQHEDDAVGEDWFNGSGTIVAGYYGHDIKCGWDLAPGIAELNVRLIEGTSPSGPLIVHGNIQGGVFHVNSHITQTLATSQDEPLVKYEPNGPLSPGGCTINAHIKAGAGDFFLFKCTGNNNTANITAQHTPLADGTFPLCWMIGNADSDADGNTVNITYTNYDFSAGKQPRLVEFEGPTEGNAVAIEVGGFDIPGDTYADAIEFDATSAGAPSGNAIRLRNIPGWLFTGPQGADATFDVPAVSWSQR